MPIYLIVRTDKVNYDETAAMVVVAESTDEALIVAQGYSAGHGDELPPRVWSKATINEVSPDSTPGVVLVDFNAG